MARVSLGTVPGLLSEHCAATQFAMSMDFRLALWACHSTSITASKGISHKALPQMPELSIMGESVRMKTYIANLRVVHVICCIINY